jgi:hypothetical protein
MSWISRRRQQASTSAPESATSRMSATGAESARSSTEPAQAATESRRARAEPTQAAPAGTQAAPEATQAAPPEGTQVAPQVARGRPASARASRRRGFAWRTRDAGAAAVGTAGSGALMIARLVMTAAALIALLIALAIVLRDVDANQANTIVKGLHEGANFFAGAFTGLIAFNGHPKRAITVDWGIALVAYLVVGALIASIIARIGRGGLRFERSHRVAPTP